VDTLHGGLGVDTFIFQNATAWNARDVISDFNTGQGDKIDLRDVLTGYDPATNILTDFVKIENALNGTDSILSVDKDGTGSTYGWTQLALITGLQGLTDEAALVTSGNLLVH
jgi:Ca2+-binding RTX toxin-like protein